MNSNQPTNQLFIFYPREVYRGLHIKQNH